MLSTILYSNVGADISMKDVVSASLTCKSVLTSFNIWKDYIVKNQADPFLHYLLTPNELTFDNIKEIYTNPEVILNKYGDRLTDQKMNDVLIDRFFNKKKTCSYIFKFSPKGKSQAYIRTVAKFIFDILELAIFNNNIEREFAPKYMQFVKALSLSFEYPPDFVYYILRYLQAYRYHDEIFVGARGGVYVIDENDKKKYISKEICTAFLNLEAE